MLNSFFIVFGFRLWGVACVAVSCSARVAHCYTLQCTKTYCNTLHALQLRSVPPYACPNFSSPSHRQVSFLGRSSMTCNSVRPVYSFFCGKVSIRQGLFGKGSLLSTPGYAFSSTGNFGMARSWWSTPFNKRNAATENRDLNWLFNNYYTRFLYTSLTSDITALNKHLGRVLVPEVYHLRTKN